MTATTTMLRELQLELNTYVPAFSKTKPKLSYVADDVASSARLRNSP